MQIELLHHSAALTENTDWRRGVAQLKLKNGAVKAVLESAGIVKCFPIPPLLVALDVTHVDFFSLDVEGLELKIMQTFPFNEELEIGVSTD